MCICLVPVLFSSAALYVHYAFICGMLIKGLEQIDIGWSIKVNDVWQDRLKAAAGVWVPNNHVCIRQGWFNHFI